MRRLPIYILIDTSGSMRGEPIEAVRVGLQNMLSSLKRDPYALETVFLSIITFDREAKVLFPLTDIDQVVLPKIPPLTSTPTNLGEALELLCQRYKMEVQKTTKSKKGDWLPMAVIMTDGTPSDIMLFNQMCQEIKRYQFVHIIGCAAGPKAKKESLNKFCTTVSSLETMDSNSFAQFWNWISQIFTRHSQSSNSKLDKLPPLPPEIKLAI
ncbi:MAG: VWA domain-containing protein [Deltaproteobacteria bacterium]|jgi:uncharacterized protein YegL|nr:VWA domain-containing protein [Deltaproteobacteria bacterium]